jgi:GNAT superfamily N-acetyltransferase
MQAAMRLKDAVGWNQTEWDWSSLFALAPAGCFGIECGGTLAATATAICFGRDLAWIGMVLTHPDYRGRGFARALMEHALAYLEGRVEWIKLDATEMGRPLYAKLGFEDECAIERWARAAQPAARVELPAGGDRFPDFALDRAAFGAGRGEVLARLAQVECCALTGGYAMGRPGSQAAYFGPCVARSSADARTLLHWFLGRHAHQTIYWDLLPHHLEASGLARAAGFQPLRKLVRMARRGSRPFPHDDRLVYAIAGFEFG